MNEQGARISQPGGTQNADRTLLLGVGNTFRCDDGVGIRISRQLRARIGAAYSDLEVGEASGEGADLLGRWSGYARVYLFDAVMGRGEPGRVHKLQADQGQIPSDFFKYSSHAFSLAEAVELARVLDRLPQRLVVFGVEGASFGYGEALSPTVRVAADRVVARIGAEFGARSAGERRHA